MRSWICTPRWSPGCRDHDPYVRVEAPYYLAEAGAPDLEALLTPVAAADPDSEVRAAAQSALDTAP